jgi:hypothetical protein
MSSTSPGRQATMVVPSLTSCDVVVAVNGRLDQMCRLFVYSSCSQWENRKDAGGQGVVRFSAYSLGYWLIDEVVSGGCCEA